MKIPKCPTCPHDESPEEIMNEWIRPQNVKIIYKKPMANIKLIEKLKALPLKLGMRQRCLLSSLLFNREFKVLVR